MFYLIFQRENRLIFCWLPENDANDARAICEAASRPNLHSVPIKTIELQDIKSLRCVRQRLVVQRIVISNQLRGLASEYGITIAKSFKSLREQVPEVLKDADNELSNVMRKLIYSLLHIVLTIKKSAISTTR